MRRHARQFKQSSSKGGHANLANPRQPRGAQLIAHFGPMLGSICLITGSTESPCRPRRGHQLGQRQAFSIDADLAEPIMAGR